MTAATDATAAQALAAAAPITAYGRGWWDATLALALMALAHFLEALPHLIQIGGLIVVILTALQKLIDLGWIKNPRAARAKKEQSDDLG